MKYCYLLCLVLAAQCLSAQQKAVEYDEALPKSLNADDYGMKKYVFCLLKSGPAKDLPAATVKTLFEGHMANINSLAAQGLLSIAGPFAKNDRNYRGIYIFNVSTVEEAAALTALDPAIKAGLLEAELTVWYGSAALQKVNETHSKIEKTKI